MAFVCTLLLFILSGLFLFESNQADQGNHLKAIEEKKTFCQKGFRSCSMTPTMTMTRLAYGCSNIG
jgi:hypothetical protein